MDTTELTVFATLAQTIAEDANQKNNVMYVALAHF